MINEKKLIEDLEEQYKNLIPEDDTDFCKIWQIKQDIKIIETQPQVGEWILVSERLPENTDDGLYQMSLVTLDNGDVCLGVYRYDENAWRTRMSEGEIYYTTDHIVTAWMPLPEPYKEEVKE